MMTSTQQTTPPEWDSIAEDILCPLCEYNLRGVSEPRCPECGYRFTWPEVLDPNRRLHRYLFEHHPDHNIWSFYKTLTGQLLPRRFWRALHPAQPVNPQRLRRYWLIVSIVYFLCIAAIVVGAIGLSIRSILARNQAQAATLAATLAAVSPTRPPQWVLDQYGSYAKFKAIVQLNDLNFPTQLCWPVIKDGLSYWSYDWPPFAMPLVVLLWPVFTLGALLVFRISMRRARIRPAHVLRCVVYSFDGLFWAGLVNAGLLLATVLLAAWPWAVGIVVSAMVIFDVALVLHILYRLVTAYWLYLRFEQPILTVLASQIIAGLAIIKAIAMMTIDRT